MVWAAKVGVGAWVSPLRSNKSLSKAEPLLTSPISVCQSDFVASIFNGLGDERRATQRSLHPCRKRHRRQSSRRRFPTSVEPDLDGNSLRLRWRQSAVSTKEVVTRKKNPVVGLWRCFWLGVGCKMHPCYWFLLFQHSRKIQQQDTQLIWIKGKTF